MKLTVEQRQDQIRNLLEDSERKAWAALGRYKFWMFGYYAAAWVKYNRLLDEPLPSPFTELLEIARSKYN